jgi:hypothetical protein
MMSKNPADRYQMPADLQHALAPWTQKPIEPPPEKEMPQLCRAARGNEAPISMSATPPPIAASRPAATRVTSVMSTQTMTEDAGLKLVPIPDQPGASLPNEVAELRCQIQLLTDQNKQLRQERDAALAQLRQLLGIGAMRTETARAIQIQS